MDTIVKLKYKDILDNVKQNKRLKVLASLYLTSTKYFFIVVF